MFLVATLAASATRAQTPPTADFKPGQAIEVREGDEWSAATYVRKEGRKNLIKYSGENAVEEWVTADRIRVKGNEPTTKPGDSKPGEARSGNPKPIRAAYGIGQKVESKWGGLWRSVTVNNKRTGDWYLVTYTPGSSQEWVEWWRLRKVGSTDDGLPYASPNNNYHKGDNPPRPDAGEVPDKDAHGGHGAAAVDATFEKPITDPDLSSAKEILPAFGGAWSVAPDPAVLKVSAEPIPLRGHGERMTSQFLLQSGTIAAMVISDQFGASTPKSITLEKIDLATGSTSAIVNMHVLSTPIALSPSGKRVLGRSNVWGFGGKKRLDVWTLGTGEPQHVISFSPYAAVKQAYESDIANAFFITDDTACTISADGLLIVWDLSKAKALWRCDIGRSSAVALSPGGKYLYCSNDDEMLCLDATTGKPLGSIQGTRPIIGDIDISPDGTRLVGTSGGLVNVFDLQAGTFLGDIGLPPNTPGGSVIAMDNGFALLGGQVLFDTNRRIVVWSYTGGLRDAAIAAGGRCYTVLDEGKRRTLVSAKLPHDPAKKAAAAVNPDDQLLLKPGGRVALDIAITASAQEVKMVTDNFTEQLKKNGIDIDPAATIRVVVRTENGKTSQETWGTMGGAPWNRQQETVNVTEKITRVAVETQRKVAWESRTVNIPMGLVSSKQGQTIGQAVQAANQFNTAFLKSVRLPQFVCRPVDKIGFGESKWALGGVKDAQ